MGQILEGKGTLAEHPFQHFARCCWSENCGLIFKEWEVSAHIIITPTRAPWNQTAHIYLQPLFQERNPGAVILRTCSDTKKEGTYKQSHSAFTDSVTLSMAATTCLVSNIQCIIIRS